MKSLLFQRAVCGLGHGCRVKVRIWLGQGLSFEVKRLDHFTKSVQKGDIVGTQLLFGDNKQDPTR